VDQTREIQNVTNTSVRNNNLKIALAGRLHKSTSLSQQEHNTLTWLIGSHVNNTSGKNSTNQTHLDKIDTEDMSMKVHAVINCVVTILGCLNLIHVAKMGYKSIHKSGKI